MLYFILYHGSTHHHYRLYNYCQVVNVLYVDVSVDMCRQTVHLFEFGRTAFAHEHVMKKDGV